jgi:hypothetical protein
MADVDAVSKEVGLAFCKSQRKTSTQRNLHFTMPGCSMFYHSYQNEAESFAVESYDIGKSRVTRTTIRRQQATTERNSVSPPRRRYGAYSSLSLTAFYFLRSCLSKMRGKDGVERSLWVCIEKHCLIEETIRRPYMQ